MNVDLRGGELATDAGQGAGPVAEEDGELRGGLNLDVRIHERKNAPGELALTIKQIPSSPARRCSLGISPSACATSDCPKKSSKLDSQTADSRRND